MSGPLYCQRKGTALATIATTLAGATPRSTLSIRLKTAFGLGSIAEGVAFTTNNTFLLLFYNQVLGLSPGLVGLALSAGLIVNAVFDPLVGSWSDRTATRLGRRHPFMYAAILPVALCYVAVYHPPEWFGGTGQLVWLAVMNTLLLQAMTLFHTPHLALGAEMSNDYIERSSVMNYNTFCLWIGDTLGLVIALRIFFAAGPGFTNGALDPSRYLAYSLFMGGSIMVLLFLSSWWTRSQIARLPKPGAAIERITLRRFATDISYVMRNRNYVVLLCALLATSLMIGTRNGLGFYASTYYWQLDPNQYSTFYAFGTAGGYILGGLIVKRLHKKFDKRWTGAASSLGYAVLPAIPLGLGYIGVLSSTTPGLLFVLIALAVLQYAPYSIVSTTVRSALADIADEIELKFGVRQEGLLYAARTFFQRVDTALGTALAGLVLELVAFPAKAVPGKVAHDALQGLAAAYLLATIPGVVAALFYTMMRVTRETHAATKAAIAERDQAVS